MVLNMCNEHGRSLEKHALVFVMTRQRGDRTSATKDVEKSISTSAISPSCVS